MNRLNSVSIEGQDEDSSGTPAGGVRDLFDEGGVVTA